MEKRSYVKFYKGAEKYHNVTPNIEYKVITRQSNWYDDLWKFISKFDTIEMTNKEFYFLLDNNLAEQEYIK